MTAAALLTPPGGATATSLTDRYDGLGRRPIAGQWRAGPTGRERVDTDPCGGSPLTTLSLAHGGGGQSGLGRFGGAWSVAGPTTLQWVCVHHAPRAYPTGA